MSKPPQQWKTVKAGMFETEVRPQKYFHLPGVNQATVGSEQIAVNLVVLPPKAIAKGHVHRSHETVIFVLDGWSLTFMGPEHEYAVAGPGELLFIPKNVEHLAMNLSITKPVVGLICRSDSKLYTDLELLPEIDQAVAGKIDEVRALHEAGELPKGWKEQYRDDFNMNAWKDMWVEYAKEHGVRE